MSKVIIPTYYPVNVVNKETILFMLSFKRKYQIEIWDSIHSHIGHAIKSNSITRVEEMLKLYIERWQYERPEIINYPSELKEIYHYIFKKNLSNRVRNEQSTTLQNLLKEV